MIIVACPTGQAWKKIMSIPESTVHVAPCIYYNQVEIFGNHDIKYKTAIQQILSNINT